MRWLLALVLVAFASVVSAQSPPAAPAKAVEPTPGDKCLGDLPQWQAYSASLKASRDTLEQDVATLRAELARMKSALEAATKAAPKP